MAEALVDAVKGAGEALVPFLGGGIGKKGCGACLGRDYLGEYDSGLFVTEALAEEAAGKAHGRCHDSAVIRGSVRENRIQPAAGEPFFEAVCHGKHGHFRGKGVLGTEFFRGAGGKGCNLLLELLQGGYLVGETA